MLNKNRDYNILEFLFIVVLVSGLTVSEYDKYGSLTQFPPRNPININYVVQSDQHNRILFDDSYSSSNQAKESRNCYLSRVFSKNRSKFIKTPRDIASENQRYIQIRSINLQIISILQKNNVSHQSSDDLPPSSNHC